MPVTPLAASATGVGEHLVRAGRVSAALDHLLADTPPSVESLALLVECRLARGEMDLAGRAGSALSARGNLSTDDAARRSLALAELAAATDRDAEAVARAHQVDSDALPWRQVAALSLIRLGRRADGEQLATEQLALSRAAGSPYHLAGALRTSAAVCATVDIEGQLREAYALATGRFERLAAQVATDLAGLLALTGRDRLGAVALLREAEEYADVEDLWPLHVRVRRLLERLDEQPKLPRTEAMERLTQAQLLICTLAATGSTNRAIADHLRISVKAVEGHLSHAYKKLEISGRAQLPQVLRLP
ncbi:helix-turn-helix transcriptional regulator [Nocardioides sp.]|uniref:helix-turn-helix transcriptional regulator n=1 Tax=Nocardioides sp. TaxID=35761 RepID=UPI002ECFD179